MHVVVALVVSTLVASTGTALIAAVPGQAAARHTETTKVKGTIPVALDGVWLLVAAAEPSAGRVKTLPQLITVVRSARGGLRLHVADVALPARIDRAVRRANEYWTGWQPTAHDLAELRAAWRRLAPPPMPDVVAGDVQYEHVRFTLATPAHYERVFARTSTDPILAESRFGMDVVEHYRPMRLPRGARVGQLVSRHTVYGVRRASADRLEGEHVIGFTAAGAGAPVTLNWRGTFTMYRVSASVETARD